MFPIAWKVEFFSLSLAFPVLNHESYRAWTRYYPCAAGEEQCAQKRVF